MNWKKLLAALIAVCLAVSCLCTNVFAAENEDGIVTGGGSGSTVDEEEVEEEEDSTGDSTGGSTGNTGDGSGDSTGGSTGNTGADPDSSTGSGSTANGGTGETRPQEPITTNTDPDPDSSIGGGINETPDDHGEIAQAKSEGKWGEEYTTCEKCGKHDWWKLSDGTFKCKNCSYITTGVKETSNVTPLDEGNRSGTAIITNASGKEVEQQATTQKNAEGDTSQVVVTGIVKEEEGKSTNSVTVETVKDSEGKVTSVKSELEVPGKNSGGTSSVGVNSIPAVAKGFLTEEEMAEYRSNGANYLVFAKDYKDPEPLKVSAAYSFVKIVPEITQSRNPVQAAADKRELAYLNSVLAYQIANAQKEQQYIASVQQQQQAALQREEAYAEMALTAAAKLRQEANQREAAYLQSVRAAQEQEQANNGLVAKALSIRATPYDD